MRWDAKRAKKQIFRKKGQSHGNELLGFKLGIFFFFFFFFFFFLWPTNHFYCLCFEPNNKDCDSSAFSCKTFPFYFKNIISNHFYESLNILSRNDIVCIFVEKKDYCHADYQMKPI